jgi:ABC-type proline/glycine betaine transport system substrate-binding protein
MRSTRLQKEPVLFYWYSPQYLFEQYDLAEVKLPPRTTPTRTARTTPRPAATRSSTSASTG